MPGLLRVLLISISNSYERTGRWKTSKRRLNELALPEWEGFFILVPRAAESISAPDSVFANPTYRTSHLPAFHWAKRPPLSYFFVRPLLWWFISALQGETSRFINHLQILLGKRVSGTPAGRKFIPVSQLSSQCYHRGYAHAVGEHHLQEFAFRFSTTLIFNL
jgi:hypothetical protein